MRTIEQGKFHAAIAKRTSLLHARCEPADRVIRVREAVEADASIRDVSGKTASGLATLRAPASYAA
jgi:hypothetical protein